ncbi:MAG: DUF4203 domain-containing protein [Chthoniobacterales bacterium]|nr:DUF4203 domain-containing protein [Chthoniobacterales bacterium]
MNGSVPIASAVVGLIVLLFGRKLFWVCVAAVGFAAGVELAPHLMSQPTPVLQLSAALVLGLVGALLALFLQKLAVGVVGFVIGGRLAIALAATFLTQPVYSWLPFIIGGIVGAILLVSLFSWALVLVSSIVGAHLIVQAIVLPQTGATIMFLGLAAIGVFAQTAMLRRGRSVAD